MVFQYIEPFYFIVAFAIGVFVSYILTPKPTIIIKYPTPQNAGKITYVDDAGVCYRYKAVEINCPKKNDSDYDKVKELPIQHELSTSSK
jgi:hypothetical protein